MQATVNAATAHLLSIHCSPEPYRASFLTSFLCTFFTCFRPQSPLLHMWSMISIFLIKIHFQPKPRAVNINLPAYLLRVIKCSSCSPCLPAFFKSASFFSSFLSCFRRKPELESAVIRNCPATFRGVGFGFGFEFFFLVFGIGECEGAAVRELEATYSQLNAKRPMGIYK